MTDPERSEEKISASELHEFIFCERAWFLTRQGNRFSAEAEQQRAAGIEFHEEREAVGRDELRAESELRVVSGKAIISDKERRLLGPQAN